MYFEQHAIDQLPWTNLTLVHIMTNTVQTSHYINEMFDNYFSEFCRHLRSVRFAVEEGEAGLSGR